MLHKFGLWHAHTSWLQPWCHIPSSRHAQIVTLTVAKTAPVELWTSCDVLGSVLPTGHCIVFPQDIVQSPSCLSISTSTEAGRVKFPHLVPDLHGCPVSECCHDPVTWFWCRLLTCCSCAWAPPAKQQLQHSNLLGVGGGEGWWS